MFSPQKKGGANLGRRDNLKDFAVTIITGGCHFSGKLYCKGSTRIGGKVEGEIISEGLLIVEEGAIINAECHVEDIVIQGHFKGTLEASGKVELSSSCTFEGDINTGSLVIQEGAQFNGRTKMDGSRMGDRQNLTEPAQAYNNPMIGASLHTNETLKSNEAHSRVPEINV
ncbi:MAG: polymer-forming cytoskeletal protein [Chitinophagaceae bacterium]|nr:polymer-forming cytoskeletal protein [Oligoflexus sp.]